MIWFRDVGRSYHLFGVARTMTNELMNIECDWYLGKLTGDWVP